MTTFDYTPEFHSNKPKFLTYLGSMAAFQVPGLVASSVVSNHKLTYPLFQYHEGVMKLFFFFERPDEYNQRPYSVYKIKKKNALVTYLPIPTTLLSILADGKKKKLPLVDFSFGFCNKLPALVLERAK
jgi:hypothetical protein